jgi:acetyl esterase/lipase
MLMIRATMNSAKGVLCLCFALIVGAPVLSRSQQASPSADVQVQSNVVFGMYSGLALLMDVYHPAHPNGYGVLFVPGSGWTSSPEMDASPLKNEAGELAFFTTPLLDAGYVVFVIDYRVAPRFQYPSAVEDVGRALRFIRARSIEYGIDRDRVAAIGYSSGANLVAMVSVHGDAHAAATASNDPIAQQSARPACTVAISTPADLTVPAAPKALQLLSGYLGIAVAAPSERDETVSELLRQASPITYVTPDDPPMLFVHGTADPLVPIENARRMADALSKAGGSAKVIEVKGATHWPLQIEGGPDVRPDIVRWLTTCLAKPSAG